MKRLLVLFTLASSLHAAELTLADAVAMALEKNAEVVVERESLNIAEASIVRAESAYDPALRGEARLRERTDPVNSILSGAPRGDLAPTIRTFQTSASIAQLLPTGGTVSLFSGLGRDDTNSVLALLTPSWTTSIGAEVRQPLMQNRRIDPARRAIRIARVDRTRALASLRRTASEVTAAVERAWWTVVAARRQVEIRRSSLNIAEKQREDTRIRIEAGTQPEADLSQATAEVERRRSEVVLAREGLLRAENALRALIARDPSDPVWETAIAADDREATMPTAPGAALRQSIDTALSRRPEIEELAQRLARQDVEIDAASDRIRPQVDLVASYVGRGLAGTENEDAIQPFGPVFVADDLRGGLGQSLLTVGQNEFPDASLGVAVSIPIGNRAARQDVAIARAQRRQAEATLEAARQRVALEVRNAYAALESARERIDAARATREAAEAQLQAENDRYSAGVSNMFFTITRQNELAAAQSAEAVAWTDYRKAETELSRATGTLLEARAIHVDGGAF